MCVFFCFSCCCLSAQRPVEVKKSGELSLAEQIASVIRQPAFIAGLGVAAWLVLMGSGGLLYCRHRRRKQLGHYTTSFAYTPAGEAARTVPVPLRTSKNGYPVSSIHSSESPHPTKRDETRRKKLIQQFTVCFLLNPVTVTNFLTRLWGPGGGGGVLYGDECFQFWLCAFAKNKSCTLISSTVHLNVFIIRAR